ncbi:MAG: LpqB family beta-propeller domain-containing protein [Frankia sp.]|nr:LpqB family beta-propeller domain-containing protein [Frankia sp.]
MPDPRAGAAGAVAAVVLAGCAGIPTGGAVHIGRELPAGRGIGDVDVRALPPAPQPGMTPSDVVHGFLRAMVNRDGNYEIARSYLTRSAATSWNTAAGLTTYDDGAVEVVTVATTSSTRTLRVTAPRIGLIDQRGDFTPRGGTVRSTLQLVRQGGEWRIDRLPSGVLLSTLDAQRSFRLADAYYPSRSSSALVPEQIVLRPQPRGVATAVVRALLAGPGPAIASAVRTAFPTGTALVGNVPVDPAGVAEVNLSASVRRASSVQLQELSAQVIWTLRQLTEISAVRLLVDGAPLAVRGVPLVQPITAWSSYDPAAPPATTSALFGTATGWRAVPRSDASIAGHRSLQSIALSHDGRRYAGVRRSGRGVELVLGTPGQKPTLAMSADTLTPPTFDRAGDAFVVATRGARRWVARVAPDGRTAEVVVEPALLTQPIQRLRLSRDGARVAAVVGALGSGQLLVGRVTVGARDLSFDGFRNPLGRFADVRGVAWDGADQLVVTARDAAGGRELVAVDIDGYAPRTVSTAGVRGEPSDVAAAPGRPRLIVAGSSVWVEAGPSGWRRLGRGDQPVYAD